tara:strand:- start:378 stop:1166 length:789 start_codon:yes stop_codon:yes gene_type:complete
MIITEIKIGYFNNCEYLTKILDFFLIDNIVHLVMPYYEQIDYKSAAKKLKLSFNQKTDIIYKILLGVQYLHTNKVIHRDLKIGNIMMNNNIPFIGDFGTCNVLPENQYFTSTCIGTPYYLSPEIIQGDSYNTKVDIYSLGCTICEIIYNKPPYSGSNIYMLYKNVLHDSKSVNIDKSSIMGKLINTMIDKDAINRPLINDILSIYSKNFNIDKIKVFRKDNDFYEKIRHDFGLPNNPTKLNELFQKIKLLKENKKLPPYPKI